MKTIDVGHLSIAYEEYGSGEQTVVFSHSYLVDHQHFSAQIAALQDEFRVVAYDHRDHGSSSLARDTYGLDDLVADAVAVIEGTGSGPCHFVGLSTGGFVGLRLALRYPQLLRSLTVMDSSAAREAFSKRTKYEAMFHLLRLFGFRPLIGTVMGLMFGRAFLRDSTRQSEAQQWRERICANDPEALIRFGRAIFSRDSVLSRLDQISTPTLVLVGEDDRPQPPPRSRAIAEGIPGAKLAVIPRAGHLSTVDEPEAVNRELVPFLRQVSAQQHR